MTSRRTLLKTVGIGSMAVPGYLSSSAGAQKGKEEEEQGRAEPTDDAPQAEEQHRIQQVGWHDMDGRRSVFKLALQEQDGEWYLYAAHYVNQGVSVLNVTDPRNPVYEGFAQPPETENRGIPHQVQVADGLMLTNLDHEFPGEGQRAHPDFETPGVALWDVETDPANPELLSVYEVPGNATHYNHYHGGDYAYLAGGPEGFDSNILLIIDVSDPENPTEVGREWWPGQAPDEEPASPYEEGMSFHGPLQPASPEDPEIAYLPYSRSMITADISDPSDPEFIHEFHHGTFGGLDDVLGVHTAVRHPNTDIVWTLNEVTVGSGEAQEQPWTPAFAMEKEDPESEQVLSVLPTPTPSDGLPYDTYYDKTAPWEDKPGGYRFGPHNTHHHNWIDEYHKPDDYLAVTWFMAGLRLFDVSEPRAPKEVGYWVPESPDPERRTYFPDPDLYVNTTEDVLIDSRGYIYISHKNQGVHILQSDCIE